MSNPLQLAVLLLLSAPEYSEPARILAILPGNMRSHTIVIEPLVEELAARGHEVTAVTCFPHSRGLSNLREVDMSYKAEKIVSNFSVEMIKNILPNPFQTPRYMTDLEFTVCKKFLPEEPIQKLIHSSEKYDLVITETFTVDCFTPFAYKFNAPLISFVTGHMYPWTSDRVGLPDNPAYIPNFFLNMPTDMTFVQRAYNSIVLGYAKLLHRFYTLPETQVLINKYFGDNYPNIEEILSNTSLIFVNTHYSIATPRPLSPNVVEVGGIHIRNSSQSLPQDLKDILDKSTKGAIVMSLGSLVRVATIPRDKINMFLKAFATLPQTIILKYEEDLPGLPPNVVTRKWLPQREIIEHKNVKAFIGHGGLASTIEAVYFAKPIIGVPFFADQYLNINNMVRLGGGILLRLDELTQQKVETALKEVINNPKYTENIRRLSSQFRDRPQTPLQTAVYWTEYVIRHQGAPHLRPASVSLPLYQYLLLDVIAVLITSVIVFICFVYVSIRFLKNLLFGSKSKKTKTERERTKKDS